MCAVDHLEERNQRYFEGKPANGHKLKSRCMFVLALWSRLQNVHTEKDMLEFIRSLTD